MGKGYYEAVGTLISEKDAKGTVQELEGVAEKTNKDGKYKEVGSGDVRDKDAKGTLYELKGEAEKTSKDGKYKEVGTGDVRDKDAKGTIQKLEGEAEKTNKKGEYQEVGSGDVRKKDPTGKDPTGTVQKLEGEAEKTNKKGEYQEVGTGDVRVKDPNGKDAKGQVYDLGGEVSDKDSKYVEASGTLNNVKDGQTVEASGTLKSINDGQYVETEGTIDYISQDDKKISYPIGGTYVETKKITSTAVDDINSKVDKITKDVEDIKSYITKLKEPNDLDLYGGTLNTFKQIVNVVDSNLNTTKSVIKKYEEDILDVENSYSRKYDEITIPSIKTSGSIAALSGISEPVVPAVTTPTIGTGSTTPVVINPPTTPIPIGTVPLYELPSDDTAHLTPVDVVEQIGSSSSGGYVSPVAQEPVPEVEPVPEPVTVPVVPESTTADITFVPDFDYDESAYGDVVSDLPISYTEEEEVKTSGGSNSGLKVAGGLALAAGATLGTYATAKAVKDKKDDDEDEDDDDDDNNSYLYSQYSKR